MTVKEWRTKPKSGEGLSVDQYKDMMNEIWNHHRFGWLSKSDKKPNRNIKYIDPIWDMRTGECFTVSFRGLINHGGVNFDERQSDRAMYERIMDWLNGKDVVEVEADYIEPTE